MPPHINVQLLNDDLTPGEFVITTIMDLCDRSRDEATELMLNTHRQGRFTIATLERIEAEAMAKAVHERASQAGHPLSCVLQET